MSQYDCWGVVDRGRGELATSLMFSDFWFAGLERDDWNNWNFGTLGICTSVRPRERSKAVERLERLEQVCCQG
jgi:hypothetical protein